MLTANSTANYSSQLHKFYIGIDPGRNTGVAVYDPKKKKLLSLKTLDFWSLIEFLETFQKGQLANITAGVDALFSSDLDIKVEMHVVMEDPNEIRAIYKDRLIGKEALSALTMAQSVGRNKEQAFLLIGFMEKKKITFRTVKPKNRNSGGGKWSADYFVKMTKWDGTSNEHTRDAARLVFGL